MVKAITTSTQEHLPIEDIVDDIVVLKDGSAAIVIQTTSVNFGLLSETEQDATIFAYGALLNSLSHLIQILIRSKRTDVSQYLEELNGLYQKQTNPGLKAQIGKYIDFVKATVQKGKVLDKKFYTIIPFSLLELGARKAALGLARNTKGLPYPKEYIVQQAKINLYPKKDQLLKQLTRLGLAGSVLTQPELVELFFDIYNPQATGVQKITPEAGSYTGIIVEPAIEVLPELETTESGKTAGAELLQYPQTLEQEAQKQDTSTLSWQPPIHHTAEKPPEPASQSQSTLPSLSKSQLGDSEKILRELQTLIEKAKSDLTVKTQNQEGDKPKGSKK